MLNTSVTQSSKDTPMDILVQSAEDASDMVSTKAEAIGPCNSSRILCPQFRPIRRSRFEFGERERDMFGAAFGEAAWAELLSAFTMTKSQAAAYERFQKCAQKYGGPGSLLEQARVALKLNERLSKPSEKNKVFATMLAVLKAGKIHVEAARGPLRFNVEQVVASQGLHHRSIAKALEIIASGIRRGFREDLVKKEPSSTSIRTRYRFHEPTPTNSALVLQSPSSSSVPMPAQLMASPSRLGSQKKSFSAANEASGPSQDKETSTLRPAAHENITASALLQQRVHSATSRSVCADLGSEAGLVTFVVDLVKKQDQRLPQAPFDLEALRSELRSQSEVLKTVRENLEPLRACQLRNQEIERRLVDLEKIKNEIIGNLTLNNERIKAFKRAILCLENNDEAAPPV